MHTDYKRMLGGAAPGNFRGSALGNSQVANYESCLPVGVPGIYMDHY